ncbi:Proto-oncogene vav [Liparis tanakae]|uniref:Proto-oncogene vav n=1 Tax=Liparis tanakae TaxID=230148 RepID=A0A4Z2JDZ5_9TELE|nr:Proto-oncogene vav [Liparis tanakae]
MEDWRHCTMWLISCNVLPANHRVTADTAQVFDLAQTLRDGVLLCQLLNNLRPHTINLKEINLRPQMSQFLCLKNIRTFLTSCFEVFGMKKKDLFECFDLFDVRNFGKQAEVDVRSCCLSEIKQTEEKYTETLESIEKYFLNPLRKFFSAAEIDKVFVNIPELVKVHKSLMVDVQDSILNKNALNLYQIFISYKERLLIYGMYCSQVEIAIAVLDLICKEKEDVRVKLEECSKRANNGKFTLRDLLVVPMQRVLKYHLLLQELVKHTHDAADKSNLKIALDAMKDLAQFVNEVKRDNETLREIDQYQRSIENLNQPLISYGRPKGDGEWCYGFYVTHQQGHAGFEFFFKTRELKKKWLDQFEMAISNIRPEKANHNTHHFMMHTFERITSCSCCHLLLRGIFNQGYLCLKCGLGAHKECLGRLDICGKTDSAKPKLKENTPPPDPGLPRMVVIRDYAGVPCPQCGPPLSIHAGDVIELMFADLHSSWWQGKILATSKIGFFPSPMERYQAEVELLDRENGTYLVRHRRKECTEYAISIKFNDKVKHIKILTKDGCFYIAEGRLFRTVLDLVEYYKQHSLKEGFRSLDTTLQVPYRELSNGNVPKAITRSGSVPLGGCSFVPPSSSPFWLVGVAVARHDFCSRDTRELSLLQGDTIRIYTKMSNGWWKGEIDGRMGWFPSTYVEEEE